MELGEGQSDAACSEIDVSKPCMWRISVLVGKANHASEIKSGFTLAGRGGGWQRNFAGDSGCLGHMQGRELDKTGSLEALINVVVAAASTSVCIA